MFVALALPSENREHQHQQPEREPDDHRPPQPRQPGAPSVRCNCQRVVRISAESGIASSSSGWIRRLPEISSPGSTIAVSCVPTACRNPR